MPTVIDLTDENLSEHADRRGSSCSEPNVHSPHGDSMSNLSALSSATPPQKEVSHGAGNQQLRVYLRVRPFSKEELSDNEDQGCVLLESSQMVHLHAPRGSASMKSSDKGIGQAIHKFSFTQIFGPDTTQAELFESSVESQVSDFLEGTNALIFSYGVTNAGKTYTMQGSQTDPGILPQSLDVIFQHMRGRQYEGLDWKPYLSSDAQYLGPDLARLERNTKAAIFALVKEETKPLRASGGVDDCSTSTLDASSEPSNHITDLDSTLPKEGSVFSLWVAFYEIYNECVYDLLQPPSFSRPRKRAALRVCEDRTGNSYVRDLKWVNIQNAEEAWKILRVGNKNRTAASTKMNQSSSRSHSIFTMKLLNIDSNKVQRISELSLCDLAGSERCDKAKTFGERLKEAGNINNSLLILGKCIAALRNNQTDGVRTSYIPFRESKLTRLFQPVLCGKGTVSMIVNINQCASTYDETLHVLKFAAVAKQVVQIIPSRTLGNLAPKLVGRDGKPLLKDGVIDSQALESYLSEDELLDEDEADMSILPQEEYLTMIENLRAKLLTERRKNLVQEIEIRREMGDAMLQQLMESEEIRSRQVEELKESYQEKMENTFEMYKDALKDHAYQCALDRLDEEYVPLDEFIEEQEKVEGLNRQVLEMRSKLEGTRMIQRVPTQDNSCQTQDFSQLTVKSDAERCKLLYKEKCALEQLCEEKQQLILSLEKRVSTLNATLQETGDGFKEKSAENESLQKKLKDQACHLDGIVAENVEKEQQMASLKEELARWREKSPVQSKSRRGLLAHMKESVTSSRKNAITMTLRKSTRATQLKK